MIFKHTESAPYFNGTPARSVFLRGTVGPFVWAESPMLAENGFDGIPVVFNASEAWETCKALIQLLDADARVELVHLLGGVTGAELEEVLTRAHDAEAASQSQLQSFDALAETIAAKVIDLDVERAKRRPETVTAA
jgi:hypothetical protein